jgi:UDP-galactopyranose mutase
MRNDLSRREPAIGDNRGPGSTDGNAACARGPVGPRCARCQPYDYLVVGAGFAGAVLAERLAAGLGKTVLIIDRRDHIGGNAYDELDAAGIRIHRYGPHIFHTNAQRIVDYLSKFTEWRPYEHRVKAHVDGMLAEIFKVVVGVPRRKATGSRCRCTCCIRDEGWPLGFADQTVIPNHPELHSLRASVVSV